MNPTLSDVLAERAKRVNVVIDQEIRRIDDIVFALTRTGTRAERRREIKARKKEIRHRRPS
jgi:hypothetical protein